jgi:transposase
VGTETTSDYWRPAFYLLEAARFEAWLVNAKDVKHLAARPRGGFCRFESEDPRCAFPVGCHSQP